MIRKVIRISALFLAIVVALGLAYSSRLASFWKQRSREVQAASVAHEHAGHDAAQHSEHQQPGARKILYWYDPMHPAYKSDKPGVAPDCGMDLVPKYADDTSAGESARAR